MRQDWERLGRRLRAEHAKNSQAVGVSTGGASLVLWTGWSERAQGRYQVLNITFRAGCWPDQADTLARSVLGKDSVRAHRMLSRQAAVYVLPFDFPMAAWHVHRETLQYPRAIRWFDSRVLAAGLGQQRDQEHVSRVGGLRCLPVFE